MLHIIWAARQLSAIHKADFFIAQATQSARPPPRWPPFYSASGADGRYARRSRRRDISAATTIFSGWTYTAKITG